MILRVIYTKQDVPSTPEDTLCMQHTPYCQAIGSLMYIAIATCPDITFTIAILSCFLNNPGDAHWDAVKHIFRYLQGTKTYQLTYGGKRHDLKGFYDADGGTQEDWHTIFRYTFLLDGGVISWSSKKQELITLSTAEAEYVAAMHTTKEVLWLHKLLRQILPDLVHLPTTIYCDNQAAIKLITTDNYHSCTKHLNQCYQFVWEVASKGVIKPLYCPSEDMVADVLTKALPKWKVAAHANTLGMHCTCGGVV